MELKKIYFSRNQIGFSNINNNKYDFIITNPPYLSKKDSKHFSSLRDHYNSLYSENEGLHDIFNIMQNSKDYLNSNSYLVIEHS